MTEQEKPNAPSLADEGAITTAHLAGKDGPAIGQRASGTVSDQSSSDERTEPLFPGEDANELRGRWDSIQAGFVDEPRKAVEAADGLVAAAMKRLAETFANERAGLEAQWDRGDDVSTEDLRVALRKYRSFFGRLLSM